MPQTHRSSARFSARVLPVLGALERGIITPTTKERLLALEAEQQALQSVPADPSFPAIHPNLARLYREKVRKIEAELADPDIAAEAKSVLRSMIKTIVIFPGDGRGEVTLELHGELAAILAVVQGTKNKAGNPVSRIQVSVLAGACNRLDLQLEGLLAAVFGLRGTEENSTAAMVDSRYPSAVVAEYWPM